MRCARLASLLLAAAAMAAPFAQPALAQDVVVLSQVGSWLTVVAPRPEIGTRVDPNVYNVVALPDAALDDVVIAAVERAIRSARPSAKVIAVRARGPSSGAPQGAWLRAGSAELGAIVASVRDARVPPGSRLLAVLPLRDDLAMSSYSGQVGTGSAAGIGFYLGGLSVNRDPIPGFLGVFANLQLVLVDVDSGSIVAQQRVVAGDAYSAGGVRSVWDALPGDQKVEALTSMLQREIGRRVPGMVGSGQ